MPLSVDMRRIRRAWVIPWEPEPAYLDSAPPNLRAKWPADMTQNGIAWETTDGKSGADLIGNKAETQRLAEQIAKSIFDRTGSHAGAPWTAADDRDLQTALAERRPVQEIALRLMRSSAEVNERIEQLEPAA